MDIQRELELLSELAVRATAEINTVIVKFDEYRDILGNDTKMIGNKSLLEMHLRAFYKYAIAFEAQISKLEPLANYDSVKTSQSSKSDDDRKAGIQAAITGLCQQVEHARELARLMSDQIDRGKEWMKFFAEVSASPVSSGRKLLFRAHTHNRPCLLSSQYQSFSEGTTFEEFFLQEKSVDDFVRSLDEHLELTQREKAQRGRIKTMFTSASPSLEWTLHKTGSKSKENRGGQASLVIFDLQKLQDAEAVTVFRVFDVLRYLNMHNKSDTIGENSQQWATNCDEYVIIGPGIRKGIERIIPWSSLSRMPILSHSSQNFFNSWTLKRYREMREADGDIYPTEAGEVVYKKVIDSARVLAGREAATLADIQAMIEHILKPMVSFWQIKTPLHGEEIREECQRILECEALEEDFARLKV